MPKRTYGVLLRVYTPKPGEVAGRVERAMKNARQFLAVSKEFPALRRLLLLVPIDHDCGHTHQALFDEGIVDEGMSNQVEAYEFYGHHSCEVLNEGLCRLFSNVTHALIVSGKAMSYLTAQNLQAIDDAFANGAKVAGLAVDELRDTVLSGRIQNTFAAWDIKALQGVGVFDSKDGVEEIAPLIRLARKYGKCIAPIDVGKGELNIQDSQTARARHEEVMRTKTARQQVECDRLGTSFWLIKNSVMG